MRALKIFEGGRPLLRWSHRSRTTRLRHVFDSAGYRVALFCIESNTDWNGAA